MKYSESILEIAKNNNGLITASMITSMGFSRGVLKYLSDIGKIERSARGIYILPDIWEDEFVNIQGRFKKGIYSLETALFLWNLTDRTPVKFNMTFPASYNFSTPKSEGILCRGTKEPYYSLGISETITPGGNKVIVYNAERTLCDLLKPRNNVDISVVTTAYKQYASMKEKNIPLLSEYAKILKVEEKLRSYLEVLL